MTEFDSVVFKVLAEEATYPNFIDREHLSNRADLTDRTVRKSIENLRIRGEIIITGKDGGYSLMPDVPGYPKDPDEFPSFDEWFTDEEFENLKPGELPETLQAVADWIRMEDDRAKSIFRRTAAARQFLKFFEDYREAQEYEIIKFEPHPFANADGVLGVYDDD